LILIFDTSSSRLSIGLASDDGTVVQEFHAEAAEGERGIHDARLAMETERILRDAGTRASEISRIGLIIGPGSFTGLRIGLSFAKGLALATGAAIVPLTQHEVIAANSENAGKFIVTAGYREDLFYVAEWANPRDIRLVTREKLPPDFTIAPHISLESLAKLTASAKEMVSDLAIDGLEPHYITEFKTNAGL
jgi:tRNA threonylcarbamoyl adenosine modification protein YeaZ